jgi:hypothetical protein
VAREKTEKIATASNLSPPALVVSTSLQEDTPAGTTRLNIEDHSGFEIGMIIEIGEGENKETHVLLGFGSLILATPIKFSHLAGVRIVGRVNDQEKAALEAAEKAAAEKEAQQSATKLQSRFRGYKLRKDALIIRIEKLFVQDLVDTGSFMNGQDPALSIKIGKKTFNTKRIKDAGTKAAFPEAFTFTVEAADLNADIEVSTTLMHTMLSYKALY